MTTLTALLQDKGSGYSREYVREKVLSWATRKWPELFAGRSACEPNFESHTGYGDVKVTCTSSGSYAWSFSGRYPGKKADRYWETRVLVVGHDDHDLLVVRNGYYLGDFHFSGLVAQPKFVPELIEHLEFNDAGFPVRAQPHLVSTAAAFENFYEHLMSLRRTLPILALGPGSTAGAILNDCENPNSDAWALARKVCGLAHVVSLGTPGSATLQRRLGTAMEVCPGEARLFMPCVDSVAPAKHPRFVSMSSLQGETETEPDGDDVGSSASAATYEWSTSAQRRTGFDALWSSSVGA
ncbi:MAG: hypothetical protein ABIZ18_15230 [Caldimonas sp.]